MYLRPKGWGRSPFSLVDIVNCLKIPFQIPSCMPYYLPVAGKLKFKCPRSRYSSSSTHDLPSTKLIDLLSIMKAEVMTASVLFPLVSLVLKAFGYSAAKVTVMPVPSFVGLKSRL